MNSFYKKRIDIIRQSTLYRQQLVRVLPVHSPRSRPKALGESRKSVSLLIRGVIDEMYTIDVSRHKECMQNEEECRKEIESERAFVTYIIDVTGLADLLHQRSTRKELQQLPKVIADLFIVELGLVNMILFLMWIALATIGLLTTFIWICCVFLQKVRHVEYNILPRYWEKAAFFTVIQAILSGFSEDVGSYFGSFCNLFICFWYGVKSCWAEQATQGHFVAPLLRTQFWLEFGSVVLFGTAFGGSLHEVHFVVVLVVSCVVPQLII